MYRIVITTNQMPTIKDDLAAKPIRYKTLRGAQTALDNIDRWTGMEEKLGYSFAAFIVKEGDA